MYGLVNQGLEGLIRRRFGDDGWQRVKEKAGVSVEMFVANEPYPDEMTYGLVGAACELFAVPAEELLHAFGEHWILHTAQAGYGGLISAAGNDLRHFLRNLPNFHTRVALMYPQLDPPVFTLVSERADGLVLRYSSHRAGLGPFVVGLLSGLALHFSTEIRVTSAPSEGGIDFDIVFWGATH